MLQRTEHACPSSILVHLPFSVLVLYLCLQLNLANNQLCGATYTALYMAGLSPKEALDDSIKIFGEEIAGEVFT